MKLAALLTEALDPSVLKKLHDIAHDILQDFKRWGHEMVTEMKGSDGVLIKPKDEKYPTCHMKINMANYLTGAKNEMLSPTAKLSINITVNNKNPDGTNKELIADVKHTLKIHDIIWHTSASDTPWYHDDSTSYSKELTMMTLPNVPNPHRPADSHHDTSAKYDPRTEFNNRPGEQARQARVSGSQYSNSFGGDSSNYR